MGTDKSLKWSSRPSPEQVRKYQEKWNELDHYVSNEKSLEKLFTEIYPENNNKDEVLIKIDVLNSFYSTNLLPHEFAPVADRIIASAIDKHLQNPEPDFALVEEIAHPNDEDHVPKLRNCYSFATKYCSHHCPEVYPIYDGNVDEMLWYFKNEFYDFKRRHLKDYKKFYEVLKKFKEFYKLEKFSWKEIDRYLWQAGKEKAKSPE
ncbi:MAG: hypothetical protein ACR2PY_02355 [Salinispira sp.]